MSAAVQPEPNTQIAVREKAPIAMGEHGLELRSLDDLFRFSQYVARTPFAPKDFTTPEAILVAVQFGSEIGLSPMKSLQNVAVINGKPNVYGDVMLALCRASGKLKSYSEGQVVRAADGEFACTCEDFAASENGTCLHIRASKVAFLEAGETRVAVSYSKRADTGEAKLQAYGVLDAKKAGLWGKSGPWTQHPYRMLGWRAKSWVLRDLYGDVLGGLISRDEAEDLPPVAGGPSVSDEGAPTTGVAGLKSKLKAVKSAEQPAEKTVAGEVVIDVEPEPEAAPAPAAKATSKTQAQQAEREEKGMALYRAGSVRQTGLHTFEVVSKGKVYVVTRPDAGRQTCQCESFERNQADRDFRCKHQYAVRFFLTPPDGDRVSGVGWAPVTEDGTIVATSQQRARLAELGEQLSADLETRARTQYGARPHELTEVQAGELIAALEEDLRHLASRKAAPKPEPAERTRIGEKEGAELRKRIKTLAPAAVGEWIEYALNKFGVPTLSDLAPADAQRLLDDIKVDVETKAAGKPKPGAR